MRQIYRSKLCDVRGGGNIATTSGPVDMDILASGEPLILFARKDAESVGAEVITLCLDDVGGDNFAPVTVEKGQGGAEGGGGDSPEDCLRDDASPTWLGLGDGLVEEVVEQKRLEVGDLRVRLGDVVQEDALEYPEQI